MSIYDRSFNKNLQKNTVYKTPIVDPDMFQDKERRLCFLGGSSYKQQFMNFGNMNGQHGELPGQTTLIGKRADAGISPYKANIKMQSTYKQTFAGAGGENILADQAEN